MVPEMAAMWVVLKAEQRVDKSVASMALLSVVQRVALMAVERAGRTVLTKVDPKVANLAVRMV